MITRFKGQLCVGLLAAGLIILVGSSPAGAATIVLTFEGLQDNEQILDFYNGGTGSFGSAGPNYGIQFGNSALGLIDADAGGSGNFANEPSPNTIAYFLSGGDLVMNVAAGFDTGFSFFYTSSLAGSVTVYDALNASGNILGVLPLSANFTACGASGDPSGPFNCWDPIGVAFGGTAFSVSFAGAANQIGFDDITLGSATPGAVPEPASMLLVGSGLVLACRRFRRLSRRSER